MLLATMAGTALTLDAGAPPELEPRNSQVSKPKKRKEKSFVQPFVDTRMRDLHPDARGRKKAGGFASDADRLLGGPRKPRRRKSDAKKAHAKAQLKRR